MCEFVNFGMETVSKMEKIGRIMLGEIFGKLVVRADGYK
jgi:hypothetical protein